MAGLTATSEAHGARCGHEGGTWRSRPPGLLSWPRIVVQLVYLSNRLSSGGRIEKMLSMSRRA